MRADAGARRSTSPPGSTASTSSCRSSASKGCSHFRTIRAEYPANWKLIVDAFLEAYHIRVLHKETIYPFFADGLTAGDRFGPHIQSLVARRAGEEWAHGDDGAPPDDMAGLCELVTPSQVIFPNTITIFHPDYLSLVTLYPVGRRDAALDPPDADSRPTAPRPTGRRTGRRPSA